MPLSKKGEEILKKMKKEYGSKKGENVFYASKNKGTIKGVELEDNDFQQHENIKPKGGGVRGAESDAMKKVSAIGAAAKERARIAALMAANKKRKDEAMTPEQEEKFKAGQRIFGKKNLNFNPGALKFRPKHAQNKKKSIKDHKLLAYKDLAYRMDELLGAMVAGAATAVGSMGAKKVVGKSAKEKAEEKRRAELKAKQEIQAEGKRIEKSKDALRVAGLAPGVGAAGDAAAGAITLGQRAMAKDPKRKKQLNKELAGDAAALIPVAGQVTRSAQLAAKAGKAVRGTKRTGKIAKARGRAGAAIRKHGDTAVEKGTKAAASHLRKKSMEDETQMNSAYVNKLMENVTKGYGAGAPPHSEAAKKIAGTRASKKTQAAKAKSSQG